jgi:hypothetical protein
LTSFSGRKIASMQALERVRILAERRLSPEEVDAALAVPLSPEEEAETRALIRWFCARYPTPAQRLAYERRAYRRWTSGPVVPPEDLR